MLSFGEGLDLGADEQIQQHVTSVLLEKKNKDLVWVSCSIFPSFGDSTSVFHWESTLSSTLLHVDNVGPTAGAWMVGPQSGTFTRSVSFHKDR